MRILIVYYSKFGNTKKLAEAMADTMKQGGDARAIDLEKLAASDFEGIDLVVMGSPTHAFSLPVAVRAVLESLPLAVLGGKSAAAFDTTVKPWPLRWMRASPKLLRHLTRLGGRAVARPQTFFVQTKNPQKAGEIDLLLEGELDRACRWAAKLVDQSNS
jgi:flavorubredoxin